jgi:putative CocE/NonD family hydrolase
VFEAPDPVVWCPRGYAIVVTDPRGCWNSEGGEFREFSFADDLDASFQTPVEGADEYELIEWTAKLPWCSGKIGLSGVSYLVQSQWQAAQMRPASLKAIIAWEGWSDGISLSFISC